MSALPRFIVRGVSDARHMLRVVRQQIRIALSLRVLPGPVAHFFWRAYRHARRTGDRFSLASAARPAELAKLLALARGHDMVVELGTGTAWTAIALALDEGTRQVLTYDPCVRREREAYLDLAGPSVRARVDLREEPDSSGPRSADLPVPMLFIDSSHEREAVMAAFHAWRDALEARAVVAFHDYDHPDHPGVREAIASLQLLGQKCGGLFVWRAP
jgi:predicted O-methyltransferase YrrM